MGEAKRRQQSYDTNPLKTVDDVIIPLAGVIIETAAVDIICVGSNIRYDDILESKLLCSCFSKNINGARIDKAPRPILQVLYTILLEKDQTQFRMTRSLSVIPYTLTVPIRDKFQLPQWLQDSGEDIKDIATRNLNQNLKKALIQKKYFLPDSDFTDWTPITGTPTGRVYSV